MSNCLFKRIGHTFDGGFSNVDALKPHVVAFGLLVLASSLSLFVILLLPMLMLLLLLPGDFFAYLLSEKQKKDKLSKF
jgi:hypothetical protein